MASEQDQPEQKEEEEAAQNHESDQNHNHNHAPRRRKRRPRRSRRRAHSGKEEAEDDDDEEEQAAMEEDEQDQDEEDEQDEKYSSDGAVSDTEDYFDRRGADNPTFIESQNIVGKWWRFDRIVEHKWLANKLLFKVEWTRTQIYPHEAKSWHKKFKGEIAKIEKDSDSDSKSFVYWNPEWIGTNQFCDGRMNEALSQYGQDHQLLIL